MVTFLSNLADLELDNHANCVPSTLIYGRYVPVHFGCSRTFLELKACAPLGTINPTKLVTFEERYSHG